MCLAMKDKLRSHIESFLNFECSKNKAHMFFALMLYPRYLQMKSLLEVHVAEGVSSYSYFQRLTEKLLDYIASAEDKISSSFFFQLVFEFQL